LRFATMPSSPRREHSASKALAAKADAMHGALMRRADALAGCTEGLDGEAEIRATVDAIEAYEIKRWPLGKEPGCKG
jgi:hypothetical protein